MSVVTLIVLWAWFTAQVVAGSCLGAPTMRVVPDGSLPADGMYLPYAGAVVVERDAPAWLVVHEFAHHYDWACSISASLAGRRFARRAALDPAGWWDMGLPYGDRPHERFASSLTFLLTGHVDWNAHTEGSVLRPLRRWLLGDDARSIRAAFDAALGEDT